jgi:2-succinyl-5-enolpyruvyl-6-hydroxy-3-cyclohexene-1-carboxylate synthase
MFGLHYERPETTGEFVEVYRGACARGSSTLIEVRTDRAENLALHRRILGDVAGFVGRG